MMTCVWCGKRGKKVFYAQVRWDNLFSKWYRCQSCDSLVILPRPSRKLLASVYEDDYLNKRLQPHIGVDSRLRYAKSYRPTVYNEYALTLADLDVDKKSVRSVLDYGCADGVFLEFAKTYFAPGTRLYGVDVSENMLAQARTNGWDVGLIEKLAVSKEKFDLITLWDVIEHIEEPALVFKKLRKHLAPGGRIVIQTPRFGLIGELSEDRWPHLLPVQHVSVASKEGMEQCAKRCGFRVMAHKSFGANAPASHVDEDYKRTFDQLVKKLDQGDVQLISLSKR